MSPSIYHNISKHWVQRNKRAGGVDLNLIALKKTKIICNFGLSECNRVNQRSNLAGSGWIVL